MKAKVLSTAVLSVLLIACGSDDDDTPDIMLFAEGDYSVSAPSTTVFDSDGGTCGDATGTLNISSGQITGMVSTDSLAFSVTGTVNTAGAVEGGGFSLNGQIAANFEGEFEDDSGSGTWADSVGCEGTWEASLIPE